MMMDPIALPAFTDNHIWMLQDGRDAVVVDPGDAAPVLKALDERNLRLAAILVTHHHPDHVGGVDALRTRLHGPVFGPAAETIPPPYEPLTEGMQVQVLGLTFEVIEVPGHIAYIQRGVERSPILFCGDTLFSAGCGRLFEGTPAQMLRSLATLNALPGDARVCCTHEYTLSNLRFAAAVEPHDAAVAAHAQACEALRAAGLPTLPSSIPTERQINPFLRCHAPEVVASARSQGAKDDSGVEVFAALREWENRFR
jgi:hydroxyacylglutathione hydrolase